MANYLTGAVVYRDGRLLELSMFCMDEPDEEMQEHGVLYDPYVDDAERVIEYLKTGDTLVASFGPHDERFPVEVVTVEGIETLEVVQQGQPAQYSTLRNLPEPGTSESNAWSQKFYDEFMRLTKGSVEMLTASHLSFDLYHANKDRDPAEFAREYHDHTH